MVSAWDLLKDTKYKTPEQYIEDKGSLLHQFLETNPELFDFTIFGIMLLAALLMTRMLSGICKRKNLPPRESK